jgi:hypothetical protein
MKFKYLIDGEVNFECKLSSKTCTGTKKDGTQCTRHTVIGQDICWQHLLSMKHLRIKKSLIHNAGKGLFAVDKTKGDNEIIFRKGDKILEYKGDIIDNEELNERYDVNTAPYCVQINENEYVDSACSRSCGSLANTKPNHNNASLTQNKRQHKIFVKCTKNIKNNEEILISYGRSYRINEPNVNHVTK